MPPTSRSIRFDPSLLAELEQRVAGSEEDLDRFVNLAVDRALHADPLAGIAVGGPPPELEACAAQLTDALVDRDPPRARAVVEGALASGAPVIDLYQQVFRPALEQIGHLWVLDEISVAQEHFATALVQQILGTLAPGGRVPPAGGRLAVVSASPDELHAIGVRMVADVLERDGWEVVALGAATPAHDLVDLVTTEVPEVVALSTSTAGRVPMVQDVLTRLAALEPRPFLAVGGPLYTAAGREFARDLGADLVTSDLWELLTVLRQQFPPT